MHFLDEGALEWTLEAKMGSSCPGASGMQGCLSGIRAVKGQDVGSDLPGQKAAPWSRALCLAQKRTPETTGSGEPQLVLEQGKVTVMGSSQQPDHPALWAGSCLPWTREPHRTLPPTPPHPNPTPSPCLPFSAAQPSPSPTPSTPWPTSRS